MPNLSYVVTGGATGVGRAIVERLARDGHVVVLDVAEHVDCAQGRRVQLIRGDARDPRVAARAAQAAESAGALSGWVNNAAIFQDATFATATAPEIVELITANLALAVTGCHTAVNHYLGHSRAGAIVNVSSHQAQRPVRGALPYATAKAAVEGLTRAIAVDHGPRGIRTNAVALGSISTARYEAYRGEHPEVDDQMAALHPLGRVGTSEEVATPSPSSCRLKQASSTEWSCPSTEAAPPTEQILKPPDARGDHTTPACGCEERRRQGASELELVHQRRKRIAVRVGID